MTLLILLGWTGGLLLKWHLTLSMVSKWYICIKGWVSESCYPLPPPHPPPIHVCYKKNTVCENRHAKLSFLTWLFGQALHFFSALHSFFFLFFVFLQARKHMEDLDSTHCTPLPTSYLSPPWSPLGWSIFLDTCSSLDQSPSGQQWTEPCSWTPILPPPHLIPVPPLVNNGRNHTPLDTNFSHHCCFNPPLWSTVDWAVFLDIHFVPTPLSHHCCSLDQSPLWSTIDWAIFLEIHFAPTPSLLFLRPIPPPPPSHEQWVERYSHSFYPPPPPPLLLQSPPSDQQWTEPCSCTLILPTPTPASPVPPSDQQWTEPCSCTLILTPPAPVPPIWSMDWAMFLYTHFTHPSCSSPPHLINNGLSHVHGHSFYPPLHPCCSSPPHLINNGLSHVHGHPWLLPVHHCPGLTWLFIAVHMSWMSLYKFSMYYYACYLFLFRVFLCVCVY